MSVTITINHQRENDLELNLANGNFRTLDAALGVFDEEWCGTMRPQCLLDALASFDPRLAVRVEQRTYYNGRLAVVNCGLPLEQVERYVRILTAMGEEALRRKELVVWG